MEPIQTRAAHVPASLLPDRFVSIGVDHEWDFTDEEAQVWAYFAHRAGARATDDRVRHTFLANIALGRALTAALIASQHLPDPRIERLLREISAVRGALLSEVGVWNGNGNGNGSANGHGAASA